MKFALRSLLAAFLFSCLSQGCSSSGGDNPCTTDSECQTCEACDDGVCNPKTCDDSIYCTVDVCEASTGQCSHIADDGRCVGVCDAQKGCRCNADDDCSEHEYCNAENLCCSDCIGKCCGDDGCGSTCPNNCSLTGQTCNNETCSCEGECQPLDCTDLGVECGNWDDGCGGTIDCSTCPNGKFCNDTGKCIGEFNAYIQHFGGDDYVSGLVVEALDNTTGNSLGITATSDAAGWVTFGWGDTQVGDKVGFLCKAVPGDWHDTYQFNIDSTSHDARLWAVDETTYSGAPLYAGLTIEAGKAMMTGGLYFVEANGTENHIGCATVKTNPEDGDVRYFGDNGMPAPLATRDTTNPLVAYFLIANMNPGSKVAEAYVDTEKIGETTFHVYADAMTITNIYTDNATDPEPDYCQ